MRISDWSSDVCSSDLRAHQVAHHVVQKSIGAQREDQERPALVDVQAVQRAHRMAGLALRRTKAGKIMFAQQCGRRQIGRAEWRERGCQDGKIWGVAVAIKTN